MIHPAAAFGLTLWLIAALGFVLWLGHDVRHRRDDDLVRKVRR